MAPRHIRRYLIPLTAVMVWLAAGSTAPLFAAAPSPPAVTVGAQLEGGSYFIMPHASLLLSSSFPIVGSKVAIAPAIGATYLFFPMSGLSGNWYIPVGAELRFPERQLGIVVRNLVALSNPLGEGGVTMGLEGYLPFANPGKSSFGLAVELGSAVFWSTSSGPLILLNLSTSLRYDYQIRVVH